MRLMKVVALFAALGMVAAACGDSSDGDSVGAGDVTTTAAAVTTTAAGQPATTTTGAPVTTAPAPAGQVAGEGGELVLLQWQAASTANPYLSTGTKDTLASSPTLEGLAEFGPGGQLIATLATEIPTVGNGGISADFMSITWHLNPGIVFSDGTPLTSADVIFSWQYCIAEASGCASDAFTEVDTMEAPDDLTVVISFTQETPFPFKPFVGVLSPILSSAQFADCLGEAAAGCSAENLAPIGTGPFMITELRPEDTVQYVFNPNYRLADEGKPFFGSILIKGGGDAEASARSVLEIGEADYAWNLQVAPELLGPMESAGNGTVAVAFTSNVEHINLNQTGIGGDNSSDYIEGANPNQFFFEDQVLHDALSLAINREELVVVGYGSNGSPTCNMWNVPSQRSTNLDVCLTQDVDAANALLDGAGYLDTNGDGVREKNGVELEWDYVTSTNAVRQSNQDLIKSYWEDIGVKANMLNESASIFFDGSQASTQNIWAFPWDIEMFTNGPSSPDPAAYMGGWQTEQIPESSNNFSGSNMPRQASAEYDALYLQLAATALDDPARNELTIQLNDIVSSTVVIPLILRGNVSAWSDSILGHGELNGWDSEYYNIEEWFRAS